MAEIYKEVARYRADIHHKRTGDLIDYSAIVYEGPSEGRYDIRHSHVLTPTEGAGSYYSDSYTTATDAEVAEKLVMDWIRMLEGSYAYAVWEH
ncbi:hypothetical protein [Tritonibacter sp. SIMBA_163]|uniref:hypothetical protein n=1 Tax=Tritonibacter sp. SIMBA_163 TaxID=3080868 RepID=UPI00397FB3A9